jgi:NADP-dependent 3-hydroxy acid dehydrogenase YdfG
MRVFEGRTAVITGGGTGIGAAVALALAEAGVSISLIGRRLERLQSVAARARGLGAETACYSIDLADNSAQVELTRRLTRDLRNLDILVQGEHTPD